jgi:hypothetical protein
MVYISLKKCTYRGEKGRKERKERMKSGEGATHLPSASFVLLI